MSCPYRVTSDYADHLRRGDPGVDLATPEDVELATPDAGWWVVDSRFVTREDGSPSYGNWVAISRRDGLTLGFAHLSRRLLSRSDEPLPAGTRFALTGNTGNSSGPHVHIRATRDGRSIDPLTVPEVHAILEADVNQFTDEEARRLKNLLNGFERSNIPPSEAAERLKELDKRIARLERTPSGSTTPAPHQHSAEVTLR